MKNFSKLLGIIAFVAVIGFSFVTCSNSDEGGGGGGGGGVSLPGAIKPGSIQDYTGRAVETTDEALALLQGMGESGFFGALGIAQSNAFDKAFSEKYGPLREFFEAQADKKSFSFSVPINDSNTLKEAAIEVTSNNSVTAATIKGNGNFSYSANVPYGTHEDDWDVGDTATQSSSSTITYNISDGKYTQEVSGTTYKIAGTITVQCELRDQQTYKTAETSTIDEKRTGSTSETVKITAALSISDGTKGGKFVASAAMGTRQISRTTETKEETIASDVEVYDNTGKKIIILDSYYNGLEDAIYDLALILMDF